ncbi:MAG TPA: ABC transporter permease [Candidatus Saccharimonadales bacterium]|nr:ABC transporter permease [Candidatus Saccharimonadales bacterium]
MIAAVRSELRKLLTVRSTYVTVGFSLLFVVFMSFYVEGVRNGMTVQMLPTAFAEVATNAATPTGVLAAIIAILLLTHEYRYNTITYTLTASRSRTKVLLAKMAVLSVFAVLYVVLMSLVAVVALYVGAVVVKGITPMHQEIAVLNLLWRIAFYGWAYAMIGLLYAALIRNQVGAFVSFLLTPAVAEPLLGLLLKSNHIYLPFTALQQVLTREAPQLGEDALTNGSAAIVVLIYIAVGGLIAWLLFLRRDAN